MSKAIGIDCQGGKGMAGYGVDVSPTLAAISHGTPHAVAIICFGSTQEHSTQRGYMKDCCPTINQAAGTSGDNKPFIVKIRSQGLDSFNQALAHEVSPTVRLPNGADCYAKVVIRRC